MKNLILTLLLVLGLAPMCLAQDDFSATALRLGGGFGEQAEAVESHGPGIKNHSLDIEDDKDQGKHVVTNIKLNPGTPDGLHPGLIGELALPLAALGGEQLVRDQSQHRDGSGNQ
jgi:hypothetical protein